MVVIIEVESKCFNLSNIPTFGAIIFFESISSDSYATINNNNNNK